MEKAQIMAVGFRYSLLPVFSRYNGNLNNAAKIRLFSPDASCAGSRFQNIPAASPPDFTVFLISGFPFSPEALNFACHT
jgi:hypothetical protein